MDPFESINKSQNQEFIDDNKIRNTLSVDRATLAQPPKNVKQLFDNSISNCKDWRKVEIMLQSKQKWTKWDKRSLWHVPTTIKTQNISNEYVKRLNICQEEQCMWSYVERNSFSRAHTEPAWNIEHKASERRAKLGLGWEVTYDSSGQESKNKEGEWEDFSVEY